MKREDIIKDMPVWAIAKSPKICNYDAAISDILMEPWCGTVESIHDTYVTLLKEGCGWYDVGLNSIFPTELDAWNGFSKLLMSVYSRSVVVLQGWIERAKNAKIRLGERSPMDSDAVAFSDQVGDDDPPEAGDADYARWWMYNFLMPAYMQMKFKKYMQSHKLYCVYEGACWQVIGISRLGDVWLTSELGETTHSYEKRVDVKSCTRWSPTTHSDVPSAVTTPKYDASVFDDPVVVSFAPDVNDEEEG